MRINLKKLIDDKGMTKKAMADILFPMNAHPSPALDRILSGESFLDENQISLLSVKFGIPAGDLFSGGWEAECKGRVHKFTDGEYEAELDLDTMAIRFSVDGKLKHETVLASPSITLTQLLNLFNKMK